MINANVYRVGNVDPKIRDAACEGLELLGQYTDGISINTRRFTPRGNTTHTNLRNTVISRDPELGVDLHLLVCGPEIIKPWRVGDLVRAGQSIYLSTVAIVETAALPNLAMARTTAAHEAGHALGFVATGVPQRINASDGHCSNLSCIMTAVNTGHNSPTDFCTPCQADIGGLWPVHLSAAKLAIRLRQNAGKI